MPSQGPVSVLVYHPDEAQTYSRLIRAPRGRVRIRVASTPTEALPYVEEMDVLFTWGFPSQLLPGARRLRWVQVMGAGVDKFLDAPFPPRVILTRAEGVFSPWMTEYTFAWLLWGTQHLEPLRAAQRAQRWEPMWPTLLRGRTLGVIGLGSIGRTIARVGRAFDMRVIGMNRSGRRVPDVERIYRRAAVRDLLRAADFVVLVAPLTPETRGMIGEAELRAMRPGAWLVNIGRGALIQEEAFVRALRERWIAGAVLDVFPEEPLAPTHPFWELPNVIVTPHISGPSDPAEITPIFNENLQRFLRGRPLRGRVDLRRGY